jgi:aspartyl-tRNA(Asn)/glutamyl-tRNA(Gln) amidotransferase subunit A
MGSTTEHSGFQVTRNPWNLDASPGDPAAGPRRLWRRTCVWGPWVRTPAVPSASPPPIAGWWESSPPTVGYPASGWWPLPLRWIRSARWAKPWPTAPSCWTPSPATIPKDSTSVPEPVPTFSAIADGPGLADVVVGIPNEYSTAKGSGSPGGRGGERAVKTIESLGARCIEVSLPHTDHAVAAYYVIAPSEASSNLARYDGVKYGFRDKAQTDLLQMYRAPGHGIRPGSAAAHYPGHLRPVCRLLRCLLRQGVPDSHADQE